MKSAQIDQNKKNQRRKLSGDQNQCPTCGEYFKSTFAFSKHLTGRPATKERRCLSVDEMLEAGMFINEKGFWVSSKMPDDIIDELSE